MEVEYSSPALGNNAEVGGQSEGTQPHRIQELEIYMYQVSRGIYRELSSEIVTGREGHEAVLKACETAIERLAKDRHYFATPARSLFREIRVNFPIQSQARVWAVVRDYIAATDGAIAQLTTTGRDIFGNRLQCRATTRRGSSCRRLPSNVNGYCPSHQHLAATEDLEIASAA